MKARHRPTEATFAWLALASAVACVALPEIVDRARMIFGGLDRAPVTGTYGPDASGAKPGPTRDATLAPATRVMGALHTALEAETIALPALDRFAFAVKAPFAVAHIEPVPAVTEAYSDAGEQPAASKRIAPPEPGPQPVAAPTDAAAAPPVEPVARTSPSLPPKPPMSDRPADTPSDVVSPPEATQPERDLIVPIETDKPEPAKPAKTESAARDSQPPAAQASAATATPAAQPPTVDEPQKRVKPPSTGANPKSRRKPAVADADGGGAAPAKPAWRPSNITNWPD